MKYLGKTIKPRFTDTKAVKIDFFENVYKEPYVVTVKTSEFTTLCPVTEQPDFGTIEIQYVPHERVIESKSLKLYLMSYRNVGLFHEFVVNKIADDLYESIEPRFIEITGKFASRGGLAITPRAFRGDRNLYDSCQ